MAPHPAPGRSSRVGLSGGPGLSDEETGAKASRVRFGVLLAAWAVSLVTYVDRLGFAVGAPYLKKDLGFNDIESG